MDGDTSYESWCSRMSNAIGQMCCGFMVVMLTCCLLFWNERDLVINQATADVVGKALVLDECTPQFAGSGPLLFSVCSVQAPDISQRLPEVLIPFVGKFEGSELEWSVEIYQWTESSSNECHKTSGGGKTCHKTYSYSVGWESSPVDSSSFRDQYGHQNEGDLPTNVVNDEYTLPPYQVLLNNGGSQQYSGDSGSFALDATLQEQLPSHDVKLHQIDGELSMRYPGYGGLQSEMLFVNGNYLTTYNARPRVGDLRISITGRSAKVVSVCAKQTMSPVEDATAALGPYPPQVFDIWGRKTKPLEELREGMFTKEEFKAELKSENSMFADIIRLVALIAMLVGFNCIFTPISVSADLVMTLDYITCCLGSIIDQAAQSIICMVSCCSGCACFLIVFCTAWMFANPTYALLGGLFLLALVAAAFYLHSQKSASAREAREGPFVKTDYIRLSKDGKLDFLAV